MTIDLVERLRRRVDHRIDMEASHTKTLEWEAAARIEQLEAEAKSRTLDYLGQVGQLSEELERVKREAERAQDAYGVRFLNYLEETARLTDEIKRLRAALLLIRDMGPMTVDDQRWRIAKDALEGE